MLYKQILRRKYLSVAPSVRRCVNKFAHYSDEPATHEVDLRSDNTIGRPMTIQLWQVIVFCYFTPSLEQTKILCLSGNWLNTSLSFHMSYIHCVCRLTRSGVYVPDWSIIEEDKLNIWYSYNMETTLSACVDPIIKTNEGDLNCLSAILILPYTDHLLNVRWELKTGMFYFLHFSSY